MAYIHAEVLDLRGVSQHPAHSRTCTNTCCAWSATVRRRATSRWAGLLHDIADRRTHTVEDGKVHFFGHGEVGAGMARDIFVVYKFDRPFIDHVTRLVRMHMRANSYASTGRTAPYAAA